MQYNCKIFIRMKMTVFLNLHPFFQSPKAINFLESKKKLEGMLKEPFKLKLQPVSKVQRLFVC